MTTTPQRQVVVSGTRPTGRLRGGHGALASWGRAPGRGGPLGTQKARPVAQRTMAQVRQAVKLTLG